MEKTNILKRVLVAIVLLLVSTSLWSADGDTFTANTAEGVSMTFKVISESEKTCQVGNGNSTPAIARGYAGVITIPSSANEYKVTSIGDDAFHNFSGLTSVTIPEGVTSIGSSAFEGCSGLTSVTIPSSVTSIGDKAFWGCSGPTSIKVENGNTKYDSRENCNAIIETSSNTLIAGCRNTIIPSSVTSIGSGAFAHCSGLTSITIPEGVTSIGEYAFLGCSGLTSITIPSSVTSIGEGAFQVCSGLTSITIPSSVTSIGGGAFGFCSGLTSITIPSSVTSIGSGAFARCSGLTSIKVENGNTKYDSRENCNAIIEKSSNTLIAGCRNTIIPSDVTSIGNEAFRGNGLVSITIPNSVTSIGNFTFAECPELTSITIPYSVTNIGINPFYLTSLVSITVESGNPYCDSRDDCNALIEKATNKLIAGCKNTIIPSDVTCIGDYAFTAFGLTSITIPNSVTSIGADAFRGNDLTSINIPEGVTSIEDGAFVECPNLTSATVNNPNPISLSEDRNLGFDRGNAVLYVPAGRIDAYSNSNYWKDFKEIKEIGSEGVFTAQTAEGVDMTFKVISENEKTCMVGIEEDNVASITETYNGGITIPSVVNGYTVKRIGKWAFSWRGGLTSVSIPETVESIGFQAFIGAGMTAITLPGNLKTIEDCAFQGCTGITSVTIPASVTSIASGIFDSGTNLASIEVESGNQVYDSRNGCNAIIEKATNSLIQGCKNTIIPNSVKIIAGGAFLNCTGLTSIDIPSSVTSIGGRAFYHTGLTSITIPSSVEYFDGGALTGCSELTSIIVESGNSVYDCRDNCKAIIESSTNTLIAGCKNTIIPNTVTRIGSGAFYDHNEITSIEIPSSVTSIGDQAFRGSGLTSINIPEGVTSIESWAFQECNLTSVTVNNPVPVVLSDGSDFANHENTTLYVPAGSKSAYENADYWKDFKEIKEIVSVTDISQMDNVIYIEPVEARSGSELTLSVKMKNNVEMESFGFDLVLPEGITVATDVDGYAMAELSTERTSTKKTNVFGADFKEDGSLNVQAYSTNGSTISGYDGEIALITIKLASDLIAGDYPILLKNIAMADAGAVTYRVESVTCKLTVPAYKLGDANSDGYVDVGDLTAISHKILNRPDESFNPKAADANEDSSIDVGDLTAVSHIILWGSVQRPQNAPKKRQEPMIEPE